MLVCPASSGASMTIESIASICIDCIESIDQWIAAKLIHNKVLISTALRLLRLETARGGGTHVES